VGDTHVGCQLLSLLFDLLFFVCLVERILLQIVLHLFHVSECCLAGEPLSKWMPGVNPSMSKNEDPAEDRAVFVDENTCIGCKQCVWHAPACFRCAVLRVGVERVGVLVVCLSFWRVDGTIGVAASRMCCIVVAATEAA
jgi:ferredoxin